MIQAMNLRSTGELGTKLLGRILGESAPGGMLVALVGEMGAGKTRLVQGVAEGLGIGDHWITSPTYTLATPYHGRLAMLHVDLWRLESPDEIPDLGIDETLAGSGLVLVEWFDRFAEYLPPADLWITLTEPVQLDVREVHIEARSARGEGAISAMRCGLASIASPLLQGPLAK